VSNASDDRADATGPEPVDRSISVAGLGRRSAAPDIAEVAVGVVTEHEESEKAVAMNSRRVQAVFEAAHAAGVAKRDLRTSRFVVHPKYTKPVKGRAQRVAGYTVWNSVAVTVRRIDQVGEVLDRLMKAGANTVNGPHFRIDRLEHIEDECRKLAVEDARRKARILAHTLGARLGPPRSIVEEEDRHAYRRNRGGEFLAAMSMEAAAPPPPVAEGEQEVEVRVSVVFDLAITSDGSAA
jgi:hypothetical protein